jgi:hypothetical protein
MLMEMRRLDRDRDGILPPSVVDQMVHKYQLPILPCLPFLHKRSIPYRALYNLLYCMYVQGT